MSIGDIIAEPIDKRAGLIRAAEQPAFTEVDPADTPFN